MPAHIWAMIRGDSVAAVLALETEDEMYGKLCITVAYMPLVPGALTFQEHQ